MEKGLFFVFEGIDGSGKTTQADLFCEHIMSQGMRYYKTKEPTDGPIGSLVNQILKKRLSMDERATAALFAGDRLDHLLNPYNGICTKIQQGIHVISDRYYLSSYAYNGSQVPLNWVMKLNEQAAEILKPTAHIFVDVLPEVAIERISCGRYETELYETIENLTKVCKQFFSIFDQLKDRETIMIVDGNQTQEKVAQEIWDKVSCYF